MSTGLALDQAVSGSLNDSNSNGDGRSLSESPLTIEDAIDVVAAELEGSLSSNERPSEGSKIQSVTSF